MITKSKVNTKLNYIYSHPSAISYGHATFGKQEWDSRIEEMVKK